MQVPHELLIRYLERRKADLEDCLKSFEARNYLVLQKVGHQLKGNGVTFGHPELSIIGNSLETAAVLKDNSRMDKALKEFSSWVNDHH